MCVSRFECQNKHILYSLVVFCYIFNKTKNYKTKRQSVVFKFQYLSSEMGKTIIG